MDIPPVGLSESAFDRRDNLGEDFGEVMKFSPEVNVPIKYTSNISFLMFIHIPKTPYSICH